MKPLITYWTSNTGCTKAMADKLRTPTVHIREYDGQSPYVLMTPTYGTPRSRIHVPRAVRKFLAHHGHNMLGVIAGGNRNFQGEYAIAGDEISARYHVPMLYRFELRGTPEEARNIDQGITTHWEELTEWRKGKAPTHTTGTSTCSPERNLSTT